jgi:hypothetical protein
VCLCVSQCDRADTHQTLSLLSVSLSFSLCRSFSVFLLPCPSCPHRLHVSLACSCVCLLCPKVVELHPTGAAAISALISVGDTLLSVDGEDIQGLTVEDIAPRIKGPVGSHVVLGVTKRIFRILSVYITLQRSLILFDRQHVMRCCQVRWHSSMHQKNLE